MATERRSLAIWIQAMLGVATLIVGLFAANAGVAQNKRTAIALVAGGAPRELHTRLRAELRSLGWRVREMPLGDDVALAQVARRANTLAVVRVGRSAEGIELWVAPEVEAQASSEWVDVDPRRSELAVLRAVEALRARFLELGIEPEDARDTPGGEVVAGGAVVDRPPEPKTEPGKTEPKPDAKKAAAGKGAAKAGAAKAGSGAASEDANLHIWGDLPNEVDPGSSAPPAPPLRRSVWLGAGGGVANASHVLGPNVSLIGVARVVPLPQLGLGLEFWWPPSASSVESTEGSAVVRPVIVAISGEYRYRRGRFVLAGGAGVGLAMLFTEGSAEEPYFETEAAVYTSLPFARVAGEFDLSQRVHLRAEGTAGVSAPRAVVTFGGRDVAYWGRPFLGASLSLEAALFGD